ncbi:carbohydrate-binding family 9-like protein [Pelagicoccus mobilis]|uniref:Carbohydrate-binding family 9-like protein n=1 Tax=Pelagicoccus mobilis TaxID=415221 RepID=A0A934VQ04_9BACT|nr:carbohydrate-binding family 9-like protein [Pelagicoccus mobilis]MBK1876068.1 carbohydrate-binding family 9-like protein [Pelagicoccus mobilis]
MDRLLLLVCVLMGFPSLWAEAPYLEIPPKHYVVRIAGEALAIDGKADETAWGHAQWTTDFMDIEGADKQRPRFRTRVKMLWDTEYLYVFAEMEEPHVWGDIVERDAVIFYNNDFEVFIKPKPEDSLYCEFEVNALGTLWDLLLPRPYRNGGPAVDAWDLNDTKIGIHIDGTLNDSSDEDEGWSVEMAIPLKPLMKLSAKPKKIDEGDTWRINFSRVEWEHRMVDGLYERKKDSSTGEFLHEDNWVWTPQYAIAMHRPEHWGYLQFTYKTPDEEVESLLDPWWQEKQVLFSLHRRLLEYRKEHGAYPNRLKKLRELKPFESYSIEYEACETAYRLSIDDEDTGRLSLGDDGRISIDEPVALRGKQ